MTDTPYTESNALLAIVRGDTDLAREIVVNNLLPEERRALGRQAQELADLCEKVDREWRAAVGPCVAVRGCGIPSVGYFYVGKARPFPYGTCAEHRVSVEGEGFIVREMPGHRPDGS